MVLQIGTLQYASVAQLGSAHFVIMRLRVQIPPEAPLIKTLTANIMAQSCKLNTYCVLFIT